MSYEKLGLKCGIEIHQQLEGRKLFCACPTSLRDDQPDFTLQRKLRASSGESGVIDIAAQQEQQRDKTFRYEGYKDSTCLVECDEEPPHEINQEAVYTALQFCKLIKAQVPQVVQVMRKTVVDGSNTSGFQRTALLARNGKLQTTFGEVRIDNVSLEEDACKIVAETTNEKTYRMDRLGIPLIEIGTAPDITTPEQCKETAKKLGLLLRSLPGVKRGLGTIRQDVNISIKGGSRVEIKGAQDLRQLPLLVELEVGRQAELLKIKQELKSGGLTPLKIADVTSSLAKSTSKIITKTIKENGKILAIVLPGFAGLIGRELQPNRRLGTEFSERANVKAGVGGIFHSDELPAYGITEADVKILRQKLSCKTGEAFVMVAADEERGKRALAAVHERAEQVLQGVPKEVRKANADATTSYMRPMPGAARMYPETDVPLLYPDTTDIILPELLEEKIIRYQKEFSLSRDLAEFIAKSQYMPLFEELAALHPGIKPAFIADTLTGTLLEIKRKYQLDPDTLSDDDLREVFRNLAANKIHKDIMLDVLIDVIRGTFDIKKYAALGTEEIHAVIQQVVKDNKGAPLPALMGLCMKRLAGKASGEFISKELRKILQEQ